MTDLWAWMLLALASGLGSLLVFEWTVRREDHEQIDRQERVVAALRRIREDR